MRLSIIIPAHNEEKTIASILQKVFEVDISPWEKEVVVVNDGSSDGTGKILDSICSAPIHRPQPINGHGILPIVIHHPTNLGKGAGIKTALSKVTGNYVIIQDADLEYNPGDIPKLLWAINSNPHPSPLPGGEGAKVAIFGARGHKAYPERGFHYVVGAWMLTTLYNILYFQRLTDLYTCYKLIPAKIFKQINIQSNGFEFEAEVACKLAKKDVIIKEVPINYQPRNKAEGKHIGLKDAIKGFWTIIKLRF